MTLKKLAPTSTQSKTMLDAPLTNQFYCRTQTPHILTWKKWRPLQNVYGTISQAMGQKLQRYFLLFFMEVRQNNCQRGYGARLPTRNGKLTALVSVPSEKLLGGPCQKDFHRETGAPQRRLNH